MNIPVEYDDEYEWKTRTLCFCRQKKKHSLFPTSIPTLKLDLWGLRISITEGVCCGTVSTARSFKLPKPRTELHLAELSLTKRTPNRSKTITWADVARRNSVEDPTWHIKAHSEQACPPIHPDSVQYSWTWLAERAYSANQWEPSDQLMLSLFQLSSVAMFKLG